MKTTDIAIIKPEHRCLSIGKYNAYVNNCPFCYPDWVDLGLKTIIGFGTDSQGFVVEVNECPKCFKKSHHHILGLETYEMFKVINDKTK